jgi:hypothetical protein
MKTLAEIYLPVEQQLINELFSAILFEIKEKKKIAFLDQDNNPKDEFLEYFIFTDDGISFNRRGGKKSKDKATFEEVKEGIRLAFRSGEELTRTGFNKMHGKANFVGTPLYLFINIVLDEIKKRRIIGMELIHQTFGKGIISSIEPQKEFIRFVYGEENKMLSMTYFLLNNDDEQKLVNLLSGVEEV